jgi:hypothetical protein
LSIHEKSRQGSSRRHSRIERGGSTQAKRSARTDLGKPLTIMAARPLGTWMLENVPGRMEGLDTSKWEVVS